MAEGQEASRSQHALIAVCVALLAAASAVGLGRVFVGVEPSLKLATAAVVAVLLATLTRRLPLIVSALVSVVVMVVAMGWLFFATTTFYGLPTLTTLRGLGRLAGLASAEMRTQIAPTPALGGLMIVALLGVWTASWASHSLAARAGAPLLASLPCLALFTLGDTILDEGSRPAYGVAVLFGLVALLFADGLTRVESWGPLHVWTGPSRSRGYTTLRATRGARGVAASVVLIATLAPGILPGWGHGPLLNPQSSGSGTTVNPYVTLQASLKQSPATELFEVEADRPSYWRILSLDIFDGYNWTTRDLQHTQYGGDIDVLASGVEIEGEGSLRPVGSVAGPTVTLRQDFEILAMDSPWLPMAWEPSTFSAPGEKIRYNPELSIAVADGDLSGMTYSVESTLVVPTADELDAAISPNEPGESSSMPPSTYERYTKHDLDYESGWFGEIMGPVPSFASRVTRDAPNDFRKMIALQDALRDRFTYDEDAQTPPGADPLEWFLKEKAGYCQQFAGTMAAMARLMGYPARVAVGFLPGEDAGNGKWIVTTDQAHAWPEIWFDGIGWVPFEPTPGRDNPVALPYLSPAPFGKSDTPVNPGGTARGPNLESPRFPGGRHGSDLGIELPGLAEPQPSRRVPVLPIMVILLLAVALIPPAKALRRAWKLHRSRPSRESVLAAYSVFEEEAAEMGFARQPGQTLAQHADALAAKLPAQAGRIERLVGAVSEAAYAPDEPEVGKAGLLRSDARVIVKDLRGSAPFSRRAMAAFWIRALGKL